MIWFMGELSHISSEFDDWKAQDKTCTYVVSFDMLIHHYGWRDGRPAGMHAQSNRPLSIAILHTYSTHPWSSFGPATFLAPPPPILTNFSGPGPVYIDRHRIAFSSKP
ncbi:hypothetical protein GUJ93_ZPchr0001g29920 [Zizania palustris]|uniref:Uncharacterized protein n=1 Tax=Zizania palustris TaxID=103762 RepID=A0A8J5S7J4_ZIZPA|nr:hypothetical protein GUJ93_ZPchr0001g29920 [Zizania palustris]